MSTRSMSNFSGVRVVRHGCAGDKQAWPGDDAERPLDVGGIEQAAALAPALDDVSVRRLIASPTKRCVQTLQPLAAQLHLEIEPSDLLGPDGSLVDMLQNQWAALLGAVLCTHGELMRPLLECVRKEEVRVVADRADEDWLLAKGSAWHLTFDDGGRVVELRHVAPLPLPDSAAHWSSD